MLRGQGVVGSLQSGNKWFMLVSDNNPGTRTSVLSRYAPGLNSTCRRVWSESRKSFAVASAESRGGLMPDAILVRLVLIYGCEKRLLRSEWSLPDLT